MPSQPPAAASPQPATIVVIDDAVDLVDSVVMLLELEGYRALGAFDGETGVRTAVEAGADLVVLDFMMPGMDGGAVGKALRSEERLAGLKIVMCSATPEPTVRQSFADYDVFLAKPVFPEIFIATLREQLAGAAESS